MYHNVAPAKSRPAQASTYEKALSFSAFLCATKSPTRLAVALPLLFSFRERGVGMAPSPALGSGEFGVSITLAKSSRLYNSNPIHVCTFGDGIHRENGYQNVLDATCKRYLTGSVGMTVPPTA